MNYLNEPIAAARAVPVELQDNAGNGQPGLAGSVTVKIAKTGGNWIASAAVVEEVTGGIDGSYRVKFPVGEWDTVGLLGYQITGTGLKTFKDWIDIERRPDSMHYDLAQAGSTSSTLKLAASANSVTDGFYASTARGCVAMIVAGTGIGQARLGTGYTAATRVLAVSPDWSTTPDNTSVYDIKPYPAQLSVDVITAIQNGLATNTMLSDVQTDVDGVLTDTATIIAGISAMQGDVTAIKAQCARILGLLHDNVILDNTVFGTNSLMTSGRLRAFPDAATTIAAAIVGPGQADDAGGESFRYTITAIDASDNGKYTNFKVLRKK